MADSANKKEVPPSFWGCGGWVVKSVVIIGFTLVLAALLLPPWPGGKRERARRVKCMSNLREIGRALFLYAEDHNGTYPPDWQTLYNKYMPDLDLLICPSSGKKRAIGVFTTDYETGKPAVIPPKNVSYCYVAGLRADDPSHYILAFDEGGNHHGDGRNVLFVGERIMWIPEEFPFHIGQEEGPEVVYGEEGAPTQVRDMRVVWKLIVQQEQELKTQGREMKIIWPSEEKR